MAESIRVRRRRIRRTCDPSPCHLRREAMNELAPHFESMLTAIQADARYLSNIDWGQPRSGHPEGSVRSHIAELERNLNRLRHKLTDLEIAKLRVLIHVHDTFKAEAAEGVPIADPHSHASLARSFLAEFCDDEEMLTIVQYHDEPYALWLQSRSKRGLNLQRFETLMLNITDWTLFLAFNIVDGCTSGKSGEPVRWLFERVWDRIDSRVTIDDLP